MVNSEIIQRQSLIVSKFKKMGDEGATFNEIENYLDKMSFRSGNNYRLTKRTFERDLIDIRRNFKIEIRYNFSDKCYKIVHEEFHEITSRIFEAFNIGNALSLMEKVSPFIILEKEQQHGTEHLNPLLYAMQERWQILLTYCSFENEDPNTYRLIPLCLKEYRRRWYLVAKDDFFNQIKHYALDRIRKLEISDRRFPQITDFDMEKHFQYCFGVTIPPDSSPQEVVLSISVEKGKYLKTLPLHPTQKILVDNEKELRIGLKVYLSYDFIIELLSMGEHLKVISPQSLKDELKQIYRKSLEN